MRRLWHILSGNSLSSERSLSLLLLASRALIKFCEDHDALEKAQQVRAVLAAVERDDRLAATRAFKAIPFGGMGTFCDWIPSAKYPNETDEYVNEVFVALTAQWYEFASEIFLPKE